MCINLKIQNFSYYKHIYGVIFKFDYLALTIQIDEM